MYFQMIYDKTLAQASYFIGCQKAGVAAIIDPKRDVDVYLEVAKQQKMQITHIMETHIHADFLTGSRELASLTNAKLYLSDEGGPDWQYEFPHEGLKHGQTFMVGNLKFEVLHTPGHTPESISFLLTDTPASPEPVMLFTGDFVFVGDVGRPDLLEKAAGIKGTMEVGAKQMFESLEKFKSLPDYIQVWPAHGAGSACGKALGAVPSSTVGYEKIRNWAFQFGNNQADFISTLLDGQPEPPYYFAMMKKLNKVDRPLLTSVPKPKELSFEELKDAIEKGYTIVDTRNKVDFAQGFIPGSLNIQNNNSFNTWAGWTLSYDKPFVLIAEEAQLDDIVRKLMRIGLDNVYGYTKNVDVWTSNGGTLDIVNNIDADTVEKMRHEPDTQVVDLRGATEFNAGHIENADHVFVGTLENNLDKINKGKKVVIHCQAGDRSSVGYSILAKHGFTNIYNYSPGMSGWLKDGRKVTLN